MGDYRISFQADPSKGGPWSGRESAQQKMIQSLTDYLVNRCGASNVRFVDMNSSPPDVEAPKVKVAAPPVKKLPSLRRKTYPSE